MVNVIKNCLGCNHFRQLEGEKITAEELRGLSWGSCQQSSRLLSIPKIGNIEPHTSEHFMQVHKKWVCADYRDDTSLPPEPPRELRILDLQKSNKQILQSVAKLQRAVEVGAREIKACIEEDENTLSEIQTARENNSDNT